jgi:hypothetical protein
MFMQYKHASPILGPTSPTSATNTGSTELALHLKGRQDGVGQEAYYWFQSSYSTVTVDEYPLSEV